MQECSSETVGICVGKWMCVVVLRPVMLTQQGLTEAWPLTTLDLGSLLPKGREGSSGHWGAHAYGV